MYGHSLGYGLKIIVTLQNITFKQIFSHWGLSWCLKISRSLSQSLVTASEKLLVPRLSNHGEEV